ncbi:NUDIX hydrolase [Bdellovibrio sp. qaytius]|nr:NUDIX hydrolase [Bdellovibrio sp. qaytius]
MFKNPVPVAVCLLPVNGKLVGIRRGIEPRKGFVALPGGYINSGETWQQACARELLEETGIKCDPSLVTLFAVESGVESNRILIFGLAPTITEAEFNSDFKNEETQEMTFIEKGQELAFPLHTDVALKFFDSVQV